MVPQGQLAYYTSPPTAPAELMYQVPPFQFPQAPHVPYMPLASSSEPSIYGHLAHPAPYVGTPVSVAPSYPGNTQHANFTHNAGSEHEHLSAAFSDGGTMSSEWQGQDIPPNSSPPPPAYPPGFEPKQNMVSTGCISSSLAVGNPCIPTSHPHPPVNALPQQHPPPLYLHPTPSPYSQHHPSSQTGCHTPMPHPSAQNGHLPVGHGFDVNGTVIGVPVIGNPIHTDGTCAAPPPVIPYGQQPLQTVQPNYGKRPMSSETRQQHGKSTFHLTRYFRGNGSHVGNPSKGARYFQQNACQPSNTQTQWFGMKGHSASSFQDHSQTHLASTVDNTRMDTCSSMKSNHQQQVPLHESHNGANCRQPPYARRDNQPRSTQDLCCQEKGFPKAQVAHANGQQKLSSYQFGEHKGNLHCIGDRPDGQSLKFNAGQQSSLASACSEAQLGSDVQCEETSCSPNASGELVQEHRSGSSATLMDSKCPPLSIQKRESLDRWLQERKHKYPTSANVLRKAEERRKWEEMRECHIKGVLMQCYHRREKLRTNKNMKFQKQIVDNSQSANMNMRDEESTCEKNELADSLHITTSFSMSLDPEPIISPPRHSADNSQVTQDAGPIISPPLHSANSSQMPLDMEPIIRPSLQEVVSDSEKGGHDGASQGNLTSDENFKQSTIEKTPGPSNAFLCRCKRRKQRCGRSAPAAQRQKQLLFKILDRDIEKESSYLLQCCRFIVNNHFLQGFSPSSAKHFKWIGKGKPSGVNGSSTHEMHTSDMPACARQNEICTSDEESARDKQASTNEGIVHPSPEEDNCQDLSKPTLASIENPFDDHVSVKETRHASTTLLGQELSCCNNKEQEVIEDAEDVPALPLQEELCSIDKEQDLIADEEYNVTESQQCCKQYVGMEQLDFKAISGVDRFVNGSHHQKEYPFPWKHLDGYDYQETTSTGLAARHYCIRELFCGHGLIPDSKHGPFLHSSANADVQGLAPFLWEESNTDSLMPNHEMDTGELGSGFDDGMLNDDDDDILQYMNFDAFETDSGICYV